MTVIITYLMRFVMVTPRVDHDTLKDSIQSLRFDGIMDRFGMVFIHDLDLRSLKLPGIDQRDTAKLMDLGGNVIRRPPPHHMKKIARPWQLGDGQHQNDFPWGPAPSWQRISDLLRTECCTFLRPWEYVHGNEGDIAFHRLFIRFTRDIWLSMGTRIVNANRLPNPRSIEDAMRTWTPQNIEQILGPERCHFLPSTHGLTGNFPKHVCSKSFANMRNIFFPGLEVDIPENSIWSAYTDNDAYIQIYHDYLQRWSQHDVNMLNNYLDQVFSNLQCLPPSKSPEAGGTTIWSAVKGKVQFVTNPSFYRIREVGGTEHDQVRPIRPQISSKQLVARIQDTHGGAKAVKSRTRVRTKSIKTRNKRNPPRNKAQKKKYIAEM
jgi:hypothetical protein